MNLSRTRPCGGIGLSVCLAGLFLTSRAGGQTPPTAPNPTAPRIDSVVPIGAQRGTALDVALAGINLAEATGLWTDFPAHVTILPAPNNAANSLKVHLEIPADTPIGFHSLRLATANGMSNFRLFCVDDLPQVRERGGNRARAIAQEVAVPCAVVGRVDAENSCFFKVQVKAGQRLSFEVIGRRLGSALDPQITLYDNATGKELSGGHSNDAPGLQTDPRLTITFKEPGEILIEVRDVLYRGGDDFWYRLRIGDFPCATTPLPMAARRGTQITVGFAGSQVEGVAPVQVLAPADRAIQTLWISPQGPSGLHGWPVALVMSDYEEFMEQEPNNVPARANRITVPGGITGRFLEKGDLDHFVFPGQKGKRYLIEAHTQEFYSPTEVYMSVKDAKGAQLAVVNPAVGPRIDFVAPADGDYTIAAEHLLYWGGPTESYRLTVVPYQMGFDVSLGIDRFDVPAGGTLPIPLFAARRDFGGPIDVSVVGLPGVEGRVTIPAGSPPAPAQPAAMLYITARPDLPPGPYTFSLMASATIDGKDVAHLADLRPLVIQNLAGLPFPPHDLSAQIGLAVTPRPPFLLTVRPDLTEGTRGNPVTYSVIAERAPGYLEEIVLSPVGLPANVTAALKNIPKGQNSAQVRLQPAANAALGPVTVSFTGRGRFQNKEFAMTARPVEVDLVLPFELAVDPATVALTPGTKAKIKIVARRKGGYQGPIAVECRGLPPKVTATKGTIQTGQDSVELEMSVAAGASPADKTDVNVLGTALAAANQQAASPSFRVSIPKK